MDTLGHAMWKTKMLVYRCFMHDIEETNSCKHMQDQYASNDQSSPASIYETTIRISITADPSLYRSPA